MMLQTRFLDLTVAFHSNRWLLPSPNSQATVYAIANPNHDKSCTAASAAMAQMHTPQASAWASSNRRMPHMQQHNLPPLFNFEPDFWQ